MTRSDDQSKGGLSPADIAAVDHLAQSGFDAQRIEGLDGEARQRAQAAHALLGRLDVYPDTTLSDDDRQTLVHATMARIRRDETLQRDRMRLQPAEAAGRGGRLRFRLAEFGAVAAVAAMVAGAALPMARMAKDRAVSLGTHSNLKQLHAGVSSFTAANNGALPTIDAASGVSSLVGQSAAAKQLDVHGLAAAGHCDHTHLQNPRRPGIGKHGFSFIILPASVIGSPDAHLVLIGDRNPALEGLLEGKPFMEAIAQRRFARRITDHPAVLFGDGHVMDAQGGLVDGDHVWGIDQGRKVTGADLLLAH